MSKFNVTVLIKHVKVQWHNSLCTGARFRKVLKRFCTRKAVAKSQTLWLWSCFILVNMDRGSLHTRSLRRVHLSVFRYRLSKNGFAGPKSFWGFQETGPTSLDGVVQVQVLAGVIVLCSWTGHLTQECLSPPLSNLMHGVTLWWTSIPSKGELLAPSFFMLQKTG